MPCICWDTWSSYGRLFFNLSGQIFLSSHITHLVPFSSLVRATSKVYFAWLARVLAISVCSCVWTYIIIWYIYYDDDDITWCSFFCINREWAFEAKYIWNEAIRTITKPFSPLPLFCFVSSSSWLQQNSNLTKQQQQQQKFDPSPQNPQKLKCKQNLPLVFIVIECVSMFIHFKST